MLLTIHKIRWMISSIFSLNLLSDQILLMLFQFIHIPDAVISIDLFNEGHIF